MPGFCDQGRQKVYFRAYGALTVGLPMVAPSIALI